MNLTTAQEEFKRCPRCGEVTLCIYGWGNRPDCIICGDGFCGWEYECSSSTGINFGLENVEIKEV